jgi:Arc/MetJ-type ribon-helix-helix transcriptional regulator
MNSTNEVVRVKKTVTLPKDVVEWLEQQIEERRFSNVSHGLEYAVYQLMKKEKGES